MDILHDTTSTCNAEPPITDAELEAISLGLAEAAVASLMEHPETVLVLDDDGSEAPAPPPVESLYPEMLQHVVADGLTPSISVDVLADGRVDPLAGMLPPPHHRFHVGTMAYRDGSRHEVKRWTWHLRPDDVASNPARYAKLKEISSWHSATHPEVLAQLSGVYVEETVKWGHHKDAAVFHWGQYGPECLNHLCPDGVTVYSLPFWNQPDPPIYYLAEIEKCFGISPPASDRDEIVEALAFVNPDDPYDRWLTILMALHSWSGGSAEGLHLAERWSRGDFWSGGPSTKYKPGEIEKKWRSFQPGGGVTIKTLFRTAKDSGWRPKDRGPDPDGDGPSREERTADDNAEADEEQLPADKAGSKNKKQDAASAIVELCLEHITLKYDDDDRVYAAFRGRSPHVLHPLKGGASPQIRRLISYLAQRYLHKTVSDGTFKTVAETLEGLAIFGDPLGKNKVVVNLRIARQGDGYCIDPCWDAEFSDRAIVVFPGGYDITRPPEGVYFVRPPAMRPMAMPRVTIDGFASLPELFMEHGNLDFDQARLVIAFVIECWRCDLPYLVAEISGEAGSGKSTFQKFLRATIDPCDPPNRTMPGRIDDLMTAAINNHLLSLDNLTSLYPDMSDALCGICTGTGVSKREHYTNGTEFTASIMRPVVVNGIGDLARRPDLIDRQMRICLPQIRRRRLDSDVSACFERDLPVIMDGLLSLFGKALEILPTIDPIKINLARMADFSLLCEAISRIYGWERSLLEIYRQNRGEAMKTTLKGNATITAVLAHVRSLGGRYEGLVGELHEAIIKSGATSSKPGTDGQKGGSISAFSGLLREYQPALKAGGFTIDFPPRTAAGQRVIIEWTGDETHDDE